MGSGESRNAPWGFAGTEQLRELGSSPTGSPWKALPLGLGGSSGSKKPGLKINGPEAGDPEDQVTGLEALDDSRLEAEQRGKRSGGIWGGAPPSLGLVCQQRQLHWSPEVAEAGQLLAPRRSSRAYGSIPHAHPDPEVTRVSVCAREGESRPGSSLASRD